VVWIRGYDPPVSLPLKGQRSTLPVRVDAPEFDELRAASLSRCISREATLSKTWRSWKASKVIQAHLAAAEAPVIDTACGALLKLAERVHANGPKGRPVAKAPDEWHVGLHGTTAPGSWGFSTIVPG